MKVIITKEQYRTVTLKLLESLFGKKLTIMTDKQRQASGMESFSQDYKSVYDENDVEIANIWVKGNLKMKGCKRDLTFDNTVTQKIESFIPYYKHKMFSKVLVEYVYKYTGVKCDCVQYDYDFEGYNEDSGLIIKTNRYNVKKKRKITYNK
jgi:hypothetical protein